MAPALRAWASLRILPAVRRRVDPDDLVQEVCCRAFAAFANFDPARAAFRAWIFGIAHNVLKESLLAMTRMPEGESAIVRAAGAGPDGVPVEVTTISRRVARDEEFLAFVDHLETLSEDDRRLFLHRGLEGLSHAEVAARLGVSVEVAEKRWERLRRRLAADPRARALL